jgi:hypothetical protein
MKLKIFSDRDYLPDRVRRPTTLLRPLWGSRRGKGTTWRTTLHRYFDISGNLFELTPLDQCDIAVLPFDWLDVRGSRWPYGNNKKILGFGRRFADMIGASGKPLVVFFSGERSHEPIALTNAAVFRNSLYESQRTANDFAFPSFVEDYVEQYFGGRIPIRRKGPKPVVGFCGLTREVSLTERLIEPVYHTAMRVRFGHPDVSPYKGIEVRQQSVRVLQQSRSVETNFILRSESVFLSKSTIEQKSVARRAYVENMEHSDYMLCARGSANYSVRLFEILSCGRIPVFVNTDCVLPFDSVVDWKAHCVWVDEAEIERLPEKVASFHSDLSADDFEALQLRCRQFWLEWLSAEGFFSRFRDSFLPNPERRAQAASGAALHATSRAE